MKTIYFITGNKGKLEEAKQKFSTVGINVVQKNLGYPEIQAETLEDVARFGVEHVQKKFKQPFILEDAGLFIDALGGFPGVYSSYVFYTVGLKGILKLLEGMNETKRGALFRSVFAYSEPGEKTKLFIGECQGKLAFEERGTNGFGYDPIFSPNGETRTFAEMETEEKNSFSHRGKSLDKLIDFLKK
jgi:XTP/dITP diphosphohydrolase